MAELSTIDRIKDTALKLVVKRGVAGATIRDLARASGVAEGTLYRYYATKEDLIRDLYKQHYAAFAKRIQAIIAEEATLKAKLRAVVRHACRFFDEDPTTYRFLLLTSHDAFRLFHPGADSPVPVLRRMIAAGVKAGEVKLKNADLATSLFLGLLIQPATSLVNGELHGPMTRYWEDIAATCESALLK